MKKLTPMVKQYLEIKDRYKDSVLLFRMGDFYEMFYEDAIKASEILQIALTKRNHADPEQVMCGIPFHASEAYIAKLTKAGEKVAICEQLTKPDGKGIVERDVVKVITPGTTLDENVLDNKSNNFVSAILKDGDVFGMAYCDLSTGDFLCLEFKNIHLLKEFFLRLKPTELIIAENDNTILAYDFLKNNESYVFKHKEVDNAEEFLKKEFNVFSVSVFDIEGKNALIKASAMLLDYLKVNQKSELKHIQKIVFNKDSEFLDINDSSIRNLEIFYSPIEGKDISLFSVLDNCKTSMGSRKLRNSLLYPLCSKEKIKRKQNIVSIFYEDSDLLREIQNSLSLISDLERLLAKIGLGSANPRDVLALKNSMCQFPILNKLNHKLNDFQVEDLKELFDYLESAISEDAPIGLRDGGYIKKGFHAELDELHVLLYEGRDYISKMQEREINRTGINNLKIKFNKVFGYYIEISKGNLKNVPEDYMRKQTLVNAERFITPELKEYEEKVLSASERVNELEFELFYQIRMRILEDLKALQKNAKLIAEIDEISTFAFNARKNNYTKPEISDEYGIEILEGRHPVVEKLVGKEKFVPNDFKVSNEEGFLLITGPNMGGKSTFLRQNALIVLMAQIGSFVPAKSAKISVVDKIFTRVGAHDNLARGESTFMVEMQETSYILNNATEKSLIILDEIGRGTSTFDGLSIAWAVSEYLCERIKAKTIFATHYHELTDLVEQLSFAKNLSVKVVEKDDRSIVFLYKIVEGAINRSYGIEVAKLSGLPIQVIQRSYEVLKDLEKKKIKKNIDSSVLENQLSMFNEERVKHTAIRKKLSEIDINQITPIEALTRLNELIEGEK
jgi:DNA mismatch repair protein MutS